MRDDFCVFILSHGRADSVITLNTLKKAGYTGKLYIVIDDEDETADQYFERYGDQVLQFEKAKLDTIHDTYDTKPERNTVLYQRNVTWTLAQQVGCRYFIQLDDDYGNFSYRRLAEGYDQTAWTIRNIDKVMEALVEFMETTPTTSIAMSQGGDHFGHAIDVKLKRKAMNSFVCDSERPFLFEGRMNDDVNTYVRLGSLGHLFFTYWPLQLNQTRTQSQEGGLTEMYLDAGTYVKSFYTVLSSPSCVTISPMGSSDMRLHHRISWNNAVPKIVPEQYRKI